MKDHPSWWIRLSELKLYHEENKKKGTSWGQLTFEEYVEKFKKEFPQTQVVQ